jgi:prevent-host-death family protein
MIRAGIRELRQNAGELLQRVVEGQTIEVTKRGRPVARIVPIHGSFQDRTVTEGGAKAAKGDLLEVKPFPPVPGKRPLSQLLTDLRTDER